MMTKGQTLPPLTVTVSRQDLIRYAAASGDFNPIHYDSAAAEAAGLPGVVVHGMLNMAVLGRYLQIWTGSEYRVEEWGARFRSFVRPDRLVRIEGSVKSAVEDRLTISLYLTVVGESRPALTAEAVLIRLG
jgi:acyl dehydratase